MGFYLKDRFENNLHGSKYKLMSFEKVRPQAYMRSISTHKQLIKVKQSHKVNSPHKVNHLQLI
jgi:hypothetical protein